MISLARVRGRECSPRSAECGFWFLGAVRAGALAVVGPCATWGRTASTISESEESFGSPEKGVSK